MDIFDDIIKCMKEEAGENGNVFVRRKDLAEFYGECSVPVSAPAPVPVFESAPAPVPVLNHDLSSMDLDHLMRCVAGCSACPLAAGRTNTVFGCGNPEAELMFIGEAPGAEEDAQGIPFVGKAGALLTKMIRAMKYDRSEVYIANIVKCRPPGNRNPLEEEAEVCLPYLKRQIELVSPKAIVLLGAVPLKFMMGLVKISNYRGTWLEYEGIKVMPTYHPAFLLRNPDAKADVWKDLQQVMAYLGK